jgi:sugar phosphate isomerase/epimerase
MGNHKNKYSCADFTFPLLSHDNALKLIKLLGIDAVDLGIFEDRSHIYPSQIAKNSEKMGQELLNKLYQTGLVASDVFFQSGAEPPVAATNDPDVAVRENNRNVFLKMLDFTNRLGCKHITGLPGVYHSSEQREDDWQRAVQETGWRVEKAKSSGIVYAIEPHVGSILPNAETTLKFVEDCPGITITLDYGHFIYQGQTNESVHPLIPYASHFHARGGAKGKLQTIVKENQIDFKTILKKFDEYNYDGYMCMEYVYQDWEGCNRTDNVSETILLTELLNELSGLN